jgi:glycerophosphoryl diester phosphodiesterase
LIALGMLFAMTAALPRLEVQGHRGARAVRPENTLPAFEYALEVGADVLELDLGVTKDDRLVVIHDQHVSPDLCLGPGGQKISSPGPAVRSLTFEQIRTYDCGSLPNPRFPRQKLIPGTRIPALEEVFELVRTSKLPAAKKVRFNIETKIVPGLPELSPTPEKFAELVVRAIAQSGFLERANIQSFDHRVLRAAKNLEPKLEIAALISDNFVDHVALAKALGAKIISPDKLWLTKESVAAMHAAKIRVIPWTANTPEEWSVLIAMGVDGINTDDPEGLLKYLGN